MRIFQSLTAVTPHAHGLDAALDDGYRLRVRAMSDDLLRVVVEPAPGLPIDRTWMVAPEGDVPWEGGRATTWRASRRRRSMCAALTATTILTAGHFPRHADVGAVPHGGRAERRRRVAAVDQRSPDGRLRAGRTRHAPAPLSATRRRPTATSASATRPDRLIARGGASGCCSWMRSATTPRSAIRNTSTCRS